MAGPEQAVNEFPVATDLEQMTSLTRSLKGEHLIGRQLLKAAPSSSMQQLNSSSHLPSIRGTEQLSGIQNILNYGNDFPKDVSHLRSGSEMQHSENMTGVRISHQTSINHEDRFSNDEH